MTIQSGIQTALAVMFPARCIGCGTMVDTDFALCGPCWRDVPLITGMVCDSCGTPILPDTARSITRRDCDDCIATPRPWGQGRAVMLYKDKGRQLILSLKHGDRQEVADLVAPWLSRALQQMPGDAPLIAPVPLHWSRLLKRRSNQSAWLALAMQSRCGHDACPDLLTRTRRTRSLDGLGHQARFDMLDGAITVAPRRRKRLIGRRVVILDDVMTTGATLGACAQACLDAGAASVDVLALARVVKDA